MYKLKELMETKCEDCKVVLGSDCLENLVRLGDETAPLSGPYCDGCFEEKLDDLRAQEEHDMEYGWAE